MRLFFLWLLCLSGSPTVWARPSSADELCFAGCELGLGVFPFRDVDGADLLNSSSGSNVKATRKRIGNGCRNPFKIPSLYLCLKLYCTPRQTLAGLSRMNDSCIARSIGTDALPPWEIVDEFWDEGGEGVGKGAVRDGVRRLERGDLEDWRGGKREEMREIAEAVVLGREVWGLAFGTLDAVMFETWIHNAYGCAMYVFWTIVIIIGLFSHLCFGQYLLFSRHQSQARRWRQCLPSDDPSTDPELTSQPPTKNRKPIFSAPYTRLKRYITVPATFGYKRSQSVWWCTIPTRVQSLTILVFVLLNVLLCSVSYRVFEGNIYWPRTTDQLLRYFADRTGIISTANLPLIWAFGIRNNTLMWLTGWDFATYNNFHRWVARVATLEAVLHSVAYTVMIVAGHAGEGSVAEAWKYYLTYYQQKYFVNGVLATIFMVVILVASVYPLRRNFYEIFLLLHIILSILVIITMYYHVEIFHGYTLYIYPCIAIWLFDRLLRFLRMLSFNPRFWTTTALTTYSPHSNIVRLTVPYSNNFIKPKPGTFYYIYTCDSWRIWEWWESHPFTLGYATPEGDVDKVGVRMEATEISLGTFSPPRRATASLNANSPAAQLSSTSSDSLESESESATLLSSPHQKSNSAPPSTLTFLIRPYNGFTSRLRDRASPTPSSHGLTHRVLIEGPYGETQPFHKYENVLFIVGGTGVAVPLSYLRMLLLDEKSKTRAMNIVWAVREKELLDESLKRDFGDVFERGREGKTRVALKVFVTRGRGDDEDGLDGDEDGEEYQSDEDGLENEQEAEVENLLRRTVEKRGKRKNIQILSGRPNVFEEVDHAVEDAAGGDLAVVACGPGMMADDARRAVVELLGRGEGRGRARVEYFEESFNW